MSETAPHPAVGTENVRFDLLKEGDVEPIAKKKIDALINSEAKWIVYLDDEGFVWWNWNGDYGEKIQGYSDVVRRVAELESIDVDYLTPLQRFAYKRMIAEGMAAFLITRDAKRADRVLDISAEYIKARNRETARWFHVCFSFLVMAVPCIISLLYWGSRETVVRTQGQHFLEVLLSLGAGAVGAFFSIILRIGKMNLDVSAGKRMYCLEGTCRVMAGVIGALFTTLCFQANLLLGIFAESPSRTAVILALGLLAGASERLVPDLIKRLEASAIQAGPEKAK